MAEKTTAASPAPASASPSTKPAEPTSENKLTDAAVDEGQAETSVGDAKINGEAEHITNEKDNEATPVEEEEDTEMKDAEDTAVSGSGQPAVPPLGTPTTIKKTPNGSSKKKSAGVPEHKTKKLNKKKSKPALTQLGARPGDYYLARMKGHPPWPSVICDEEMLPQSLIDTRPVTTKQPDGTFKKPEYADGGKRAYERTFPIMFLHTNEFAWIANTDLTPLDPATCGSVEAKGKTKNLLAAYQTASENQNLDHYKKVLQDHQAAVQEEAEAQAEREAKKASKAKRKSVDASALADDADEMDVDDEEPAPKPKSKKRKKEPDSDEAEEKPAKTPKTATKIKLSTPKTPATEPSKKKTAKPKASTGKKAAAKAASDDEAVDTPKVEEKPLTAAEKKEKKEKMVLYYRHKLQRGFLARDNAPKKDEMKPMSDFLKELESYPDLEGSIIRSTKIHKVLKAMIKLTSIPLDEEFHFRDRAHALLAKWNEILASDPNAAAADKEESKPESSTSVLAPTNGETKDPEKQALEAEVGMAAAPEEEKDEKLENKIGTTTEGEKEAEKSEETKETNESEKTDAPAVDSAPAEEYKPPVVETEDEPDA